jgi:hypothetical protein
MVRRPMEIIMESSVWGLDSHLPSGDGDSHLFLWSSGDGWLLGVDETVVSCKTVYHVGQDGF